MNTSELLNVIFVNYEKQENYKMTAATLSGKISQYARSDTS